MPQILLDDLSKYHAIKNLDFVEEYLCFEEIESTNSFAKEQKSSPSSGLIVIRALKQSGGRGRREKTFFSDHSGGLWASIITPVKNISDHFIYNRALSLAVCEAVKAAVKCRNPRHIDCTNHRETAVPEAAAFNCRSSIKGIDPQISNKIKIKWPNDIYFGDRKIAGMLLENVSTDPNVIIAGLGLNINIMLDDFPAKLRDSATSTLIETGQILPVDLLLERILTAYWRIIRDNNQQIIHEQYIENLYKRGCDAVIDNYEGVFLTVEQSGQLKMQTDQGDKFFSSGTLRFLESNQ